MSGGDGLPKGWARATIGELVSKRGVFCDGDWVESKDQDPDGDVRLIQLADVGDGDYRNKSNRFLTSEKAAQLGCTFLEPGDILIARMPDPLGRACIFPGDSKRSVTVVDVCIVRTANGNADHRCLMCFVNSPQFRVKVASLQSGSTRKRISRTHLGTIPLRVPPANEQRRIVAKIEELFSSLDAGVAALERARVNLKRYRAAVLKAAVEGRLTEKWRAENPPQEPAPQLLRRILADRRRKWEQQQLAAYAAKGNKPPANWKDKYKEPAEPEASKLPELPEAWCWATIDACGQVVGGITKGQKRAANTCLREVPYLRVANVQRGYLDLNVMKTIPATQEEIAQLRLERGDILFTEGGDRDKLGRGWVWSGEIPECIHQNHVFRVRPFLPTIQSNFISYHGNSFGQFWFLRTGKQSVNLASINMTVLKRFPVPLPPTPEQAEIVSLVDERLSVLDAAEAEIDMSLLRAARLRQSILKRAFEGKLVPQDPSDEPAEMLLERVKQEKHHSGNRKPPKTRRRKGGKSKSSTQRTLF